MRPAGVPVVSRTEAGRSFESRSSHNAVILGSLEVGKAHLAVALGIKAIQAANSTLYVLSLETLMPPVVTSPSHFTSRSGLARATN